MLGQICGKAVSDAAAALGATAQLCADNGTTVAHSYRER